MSDVRRFGKSDSGRMKLILPDYSAPLRFLTQNDALDVAISKLDHAIYDELAAKTHNSLQSINGDSPYYHIAQNIYEALIPYGGYTPSAANPFATVDWTNSLFVAQAMKTAYGTVYNTAIVYLDSGTVSYGEYYAGSDSGFTAAKIIISFRGTDSESKTHHHNTNFSWSWILTGKRFTVSIYQYRAGMTQPLLWLAVGQ